MAHHDRDVVCSPINTHERRSRRTAGCNHTLRRRSRMFKLCAGSKPGGRAMFMSSIQPERIAAIWIPGEPWVRLHASERLTRVAGRSWPAAGMKGTLKPAYGARSPCLDGNSIANRHRSAARSTNARCVDAVCRQPAHAPNDMSAMRRPRPSVARGIRRL